MEREIRKMAAKKYGIEITIKTDKSNHAWMFDGDTNINIAVGRNRGYSLTGKSKDRAVRFASDDLRRYVSRAR